MEMGEKIKQKRLEIGLNQKTLAGKIGVSQTHLSQVEKGAKGLSRKSLILAANALGLSTEYLLGGTAPMLTDDALDPSNIRYPDIIKVPLLDVKTCAGLGSSHLFEDVEVIGEREVSVQRVGVISIYEDKRPFVTIVDGDSMAAAGLPDGTEVVVNPAEEVHSADVAMVCFGEDWKTAIKWIYFKPGGVIEMRSASPGYPVYEYTKEQQENPENPLIIIGKVMSFTGVPKRGI